jgi:hypothetical protein
MVRGHWPMQGDRGGVLVTIIQLGTQAERGDGPDGTDPSA